MEYDYHDISKMIDHALLAPTLDRNALLSGCRLAAAYDVASVCILPYFVGHCAEVLAASSVLTSTVIGFPHGGQATGTKLAEAEIAIADGAVELDMVCNISAVLSGDWRHVDEEITGIVQLGHAAGCKVKVIFENCYLNDEQKRKLCEISVVAQADWIKTSTGFGTGGATLQDLRLMIEHAVPPTEVKASGGIRNLETVLEYKALGVTRVGASATTAILDPVRRELGLAPIELGADPTGWGY